jgi:hypothetical protein
MSEKTKFRIAMALSLVVATAGYLYPSRQRPLDFRAMLTVSIPAVVIWVGVFMFCLWRFGKRGLWLAVGIVPASWWPVWMLVNDFPGCYYLHNCK